MVLLLGSILRVPVAASKITPAGTVVLLVWAVPLLESVVTTKVGVKLLSTLSVAVSPWSASLALASKLIVLCAAPLLND